MIDQELMTRVLARAVDELEAEGRADVAAALVEPSRASAGMGFDEFNIAWMSVQLDGAVVALIDLRAIGAHFVGDELVLLDSPLDAV